MSIMEFLTSLLCSKDEQDIAPMREIFTVTRTNKKEALLHDIKAVLVKPLQL
jgi:hypothetical protein